MEIIMEMQGVWKIYRMGDFDVPALAGIDLAIKKGEFVACLLYTSDAADE